MKLLTFRQNAFVYLSGTNKAQDEKGKGQKAELQTPESQWTLALYGEAEVRIQSYKHEELCSANKQEVHQLIFIRELSLVPPL